jgi:hypothetical protein
MGQSQRNNNNNMNNNRVYIRFRDVGEYKLLICLYILSVSGSMSSLIGSSVRILKLIEILSQS